MNDYKWIVDEGYSFDPGKYFAKGWKLFVKDAGSFIGFTILYFILSIIVSLIPFVGLFSTIVQMTLTAGYFVFCHRLVSGEQQFSNFFEGFNQFLQILLYAVLMFVFMIPLIFLFFKTVIPFDFFKDLILTATRNPNDMQDVFYDFIYLLEDSLPFLVLIIFGFLYLYISYTLTLPLIVIDKLDFWNAMELSRRMVARHFGTWIIFYVLLIVIYAMGTAITCGIGFIVLTPFMYCTIYSVYQDILAGKIESKTSESNE